MLSASLGNYLRVRGEYALIDLSYERIEELPPRARRIHPIGLHGNVPTGTTSACAENTHALLRIMQLYWNYLRVRGEYYPTATRLYGAWELPPRARRIPIMGE